MGVNPVIGIQFGCSAQLTEIMERLKKADLGGFGDRTCWQVSIVLDEAWAVADRIIAQSLRAFAIEVAEW